MKSAKCDYCGGDFQVLVYIIIKKKKACLGCLDTVKELKEFRLTNIGKKL